MSDSRTTLSRKPDVRMRTDNAAAIEALERTIAASEALRVELERGEESGRRMVEELRAGKPFDESVVGAGSSMHDLRDSSRQQLDVYLDGRRTVRLILIDTCLRAGFSRGRIAAMLGVTRQRVTVLAKDIA